MICAPLRHFSRRFGEGGLAFVVSRPCLKDEGTARIGHPAFLAAATIFRIFSRMVFALLRTTSIVRFWGLIACKVSKTFFAVLVVCFVGFRGVAEIGGLDKNGVRRFCSAGLPSMNSWRPFTKPPLIEFGTFIRPRGSNAIALAEGRQTGSLFLLHLRIENSIMVIGGSEKESSGLGVVSSKCPARAEPLPIFQPLGPLPGLKFQTWGTHFCFFINLGGPKTHEDTTEVIAGYKARLPRSQEGFSAA